jgi:hypothetical protein
MIDEKTIRDDRVVLAFERPSVLGQIVPGVRSGSAYRKSNEQPSPQYLHLTCISGNESGSTFKILRCNVLSYERAPADPHGDYDGTLFVADQSILEKLGAPFGGFWTKKRRGKSLSPVNRSSVVMLARSAALEALCLMPPRLECSIF